MDFMKVIDQAVREIKREVNLKVLKIPEIEQKVLDATDDEPWGPHGTDLADIARATNKFGECQIIMSVLWTRLRETGKDWRYVYKALTVVEYLVAHGSDRAVDEIIEHTYQIASLSSFEYVEPGGKDVGINVRTRAEKIVALLNDREKIQQVRNKAEANRNKYVGLSSTGISYKSASSSSGISSFQSGNRYRETSNETARRGDEKSSYPRMSSQARANVEGNSTKKLPARVSWPSNLKSPSKTAGTNKSSMPSKMYDDDEDDFNPRATSSPKTAVGNSTRVEQPGLDLIDLLDAPAPAVAGNATNVQDMQNQSSQTDLFADADFVSASSAGSLIQDQVDLFASGSTISPVGPSPVDLFATPNAATELPEEPTKPDPPNLTDFDPFPAIPPPSADSGHDPFMEFKSISNSTEVPSPKTDVNGKPCSESHAPPRKETFQVKSGIWADSLSRGLINLDITESKKVSLADVGVVGDLSEGGGDLWEMKAHH
ncbi:hypothetical protein MLD38_014668 [Melastoma candidum]|uniref:Uncharacterized protein n=1 Tax=Melastoma candidum TaxID=119954 RepID=A0ACB9RHQ0_9MYRT|nr:hypothetical protein MLD38_014668 [Melastoma candidum]